MPAVAIVPVVVLMLLLASPAAAQSPAADCTHETATTLAHQVDPFLLDDPVVQFLCGPFTGPGSQAMAIETGPAPTCWPVQHWGVFVFENGAWRKVLDRWEYVIGDLVAVGGDLRVTTAVHRDKTEPRCIFEGGSQARNWHWNGTRFVAGKPEQVTPPKPRTHAFFNTPPGLRTQCGMSDQPGESGVGITCQSVSSRPKLYQQKVTMGANGRASICRDRGLHNRCNLGDAGEERVPTYKYGTDVTIGRFRCRVRRSGVQCTVIATGKGFVINRNRAARL